MQEPRSLMLCHNQKEHVGGEEGRNCVKSHLLRKECLIWITGCETGECIA